MKFVIESMFHQYSSLGILGIETSKALEGLGNSVVKIPWPEYQTESLANVDYWVKIAIGPSKVDYIKKTSKKFLFMPIFESTEMTKWFPRQLFDSADMFVCPSKFVLDHLKYPQPKLIWNHGVVPHKFKKQKTNFDEPLRLLMVATLDTRKFGDEFLELFYNRFRNNKDIELLVKCQPDYKIKIKNCDNIKFMPTILAKDGLYTLYSICDALIMPSRGEAFGLPALEAASVGLPLIISNWGGQLDYIDDCVALKINGKLVDTPKDGPWEGQWFDPDKDEIESHILTFISDRSWLEAGRANRDHVINKWSWKEVTKQFYEKLF